MLSPEAVEILLKVKAHILEEPNRLVMGDWIVRKDDWRKNFFSGDDDEKKFFSGDDDEQIPFAQCGTAGCIAGWVVLLHDGIEETNHMQWNTTVQRRAKELLHITEEEPSLFYVTFWDRLKPGLNERYHNATTQQERAELVGEAIDAYIEQENQKQEVAQ